MAALGLRPEDYAEDEDVYEVWPENWPVFNLWQIVGDQWLMGSGGPVALNLLPAFHELDRMELPKEEYDRWVLDLKAMSAVAMRQLAPD